MATSSRLGAVRRGDRHAAEHGAVPKPLSRELRKGATVDEIKGIARVKFHPGRVEEWKRLSEEAMEIVRTRDSGTLQYEIFLNEDESEAIVFERYRDADAAIEHFSNISHLMEPIMPPLPSRAKCWERRTRR